MALLSSPESSLSLRNDSLHRVELNASATTFCRPFCLRDLLASKKGCRPIGGQNQLGDLLVSFCHPFGGQKKLHDLLPSFFQFWTPKSHQKDDKKSHNLFCPPIWSATKKRQQKVAEVILDGKKSPWGKGRQKVVALAFTFSNCVLIDVIFKQ